MVLRSLVVGKTRRVHGGISVNIRILPTRPNTQGCRVKDDWRIKISTSTIRHRTGKERRPNDRCCLALNDKWDEVYLSRLGPLHTLTIFRSRGLSLVKGKCGPPYLILVSVSMWKSKKDISVSWLRTVIGLSSRILGFWVYSDVETTKVGTPWDSSSGSRWLREKIKILLSKLKGSMTLVRFYVRTTIIKRDVHYTEFPRVLFIVPPRNIPLSSFGFDNNRTLKNVHNSNGKPVRKTPHTSLNGHWTENRA